MQLKEQGAQQVCSRTVFIKLPHFLWIETHNIILFMKNQERGEGFLTDYLQFCQGFLIEHFRQKEYDTK